MALEYLHEQEKTHLICVKKTNLKKKKQLPEDFIYHSL